MKKAHVVGASLDSFFMKKAHVVGASLDSFFMASWLYA